MKHRKIVLLTLVLLGVLGATGLGTSYLLPSVVPAHALACPFGGPGTPSCLTVSLDPISKPTKTAVTGCTIPVGQYGLCDTVISLLPTPPNTPPTNVTTFRVGAILNATIANPAMNVFAWQFQINYDPTVVTPQGDPSVLCTGYPDCGEKTVWFGSQSATGTGNWAASIGIGAGNPGGGTGAISICENGGAGSKCADPHTGFILVGFTFVNPSISPAITLSARTVLASVAFEIVSKGTATLIISNVQFTDSAAVVLPGFAAAPTTSCTPVSCGQTNINVANNPPHASFTTSHTGTSYTFTSTSTDADAGDILTYVWDFGDRSPLMTTATATHDYGINGAKTGPGNFIVTLRVTDSQGATGAVRSPSGTVLVNGQPSHSSSNLGLVEVGPTAAFTFAPSTPTAGTVVNFDASHSSYPDEPILAGTAPPGGSGLANADTGLDICATATGINCPIGFVDNNANGIFDPGVDTVVRANDGGAVFIAGDDIMAGPTIAPSNQPILFSDPKISFFDTNLNANWDPGEPVIYDTNGNFLYDGIKTYTWDFGDPASGTSNTATGISATHTFNPTTTTTFTVKLTVTDNLGGTANVNNPVPVTAVQAKHPTTTTVSCAPSTITTAETSLCTATVTDTATSGAAPPSGTMAFSQTGISSGTSFTTSPCTLATPTTNSASCSVTFASTNTGVASISAAYTPAATDTTHSPSSSTAPAMVTVNAAAHATTTSVSCSPSTVVVGTTTGCTATVTSTTLPTAGGTVSWSHTGTGSFNSVTCILNQAATDQCSVVYTPTGATGTQDITANYLGDAQNAPSTSSPFTITVAIDPTSTVITCSPLAVAPTQTVTCTATVTDTVTGRTPLTPSGTVTWTHTNTGSFNSITCTLNQGATDLCSVTYTPTATGSHDISANYGGDTQHSPSSTSTPTSITVTLDSTSITIACTPLAIAPTQTSGCTATVTDTVTGRGPVTPSGTVTWTHTNTGAFNSVTCVLNQATTDQCSVIYTPTALGSHDLSATYSGDTVHAPSGPATAATITVTLDPTNISVTCNPLGVAPTQTVTCTATLTDTVTGRAPVTPSGTVTWSHTGNGNFNSVTCTLNQAATDQCSVIYTPAATGTHGITASYGGDAIHATSSTSTAANIDVTLDPTSTNVSCTPSSPSIGQAVSCTATVTDTVIGRAPVTPSGTVTWTTTGSGTFNSVTCTLNQASTDQCFVTYTPTTSGSHLIKGAYGGDAIHDISTGQFTVTIGLNPTGTSVSCTPATILIGQTTQCTATVTDTSTTGATTPTGTVTFTPGGTCTLGTPATTSASCSVTISPTSTVSVSANYGGDTSHGSSQGTATVTVGLRSTTVSVTCTPATISVGQTASCTATVTDTAAGTAIPPTGTVTFNPTATCTLGPSTGASATCSATEASTPNPGSLFVTATYAGDTTHTGSGPSTAFTITVNGRTTSTTVSCPANGTVGTPFSCTVTVADTDTGTSSTPTGTFTVNGQTCTLASGTCTISITPIATGSVTVTANYPGDTTHTTSTGSATVNVSQPAAHTTTTTVTCTPSTIPFDPTGLAPTSTTANCNATVVDPSAVPTTPTGSVTFTQTGIASGASFTGNPCTLSPTTVPPSGTAQCSLNFSSATIGTASITAAYAGDSGHNGSDNTAAPAIVTVTIHPTQTFVSCLTPIVPGQSADCNALVDDTIPVFVQPDPRTPPTGTVSFATSGSGSFSSPQCTLIVGQNNAQTGCTVKYTPAGTTLPFTDTITATYSGDSTHSAGAPVTGPVTVSKRVTITTVTCTPNSITTTQTSNCTAIVDSDASPGTGITPTGTVTFSQTGISTGAAFTGSPCILVPGTVPSSASCSVTFSSTSTGTASITGTFDGDSTHVGSISSQGFSVQVNTAQAHSTSVVIACNPTSIVVGQSSTCTATVTDTSTVGATIPTGSVTFTPNGGCTLAAGTCSASVNSAIAGSISVSANYPGDTTHTGSTSNTITLTVGIRTTSTSITCVSPVSAGSATTCTVTVTDTSTGSLPGINPTGTVTVTSSGAGTFTGTCNLAPITTPPIPIGTTTCQVTFTPSGTTSRTDTITADYGGDAVHSGSSGTFQLSITVNQTPPTVTFTEDKTTAFRGQMITLTITTVPGTGTIDTVRVDWGDSTIDTLLGTATTDSHAYSNLGSFKVMVTVTDSNSLTASDTATKTIINQLPTISFSEDKTTAPTSTSITLTITSSDLDGTVSSITVNWGDNTPLDNLAGTATTDTHTYAKAGSYTVTVTATDNDGGKTTAPTATKTITDRPPVAAFTESMTTAPTGTAISFNASGSTDPDGTIATYAWNFGDTITGTGVTVSHSYIKAGSYTVTLTVTDDSGSTAQTTGTKTITDRAPTASFTFTPANPIVGQTVTFDGTASTDLDGTIASYAWSFGDTTTSTGATTTHAYTATGTFTVTLTVTDDAGLTGITTHTVTVTQPVTNPGHAKLIQWRAEAKFSPDNLRRNPTQVLRAYGQNDGTVTVNVYVQFIITNPDGTTNTIYTKVVSLTPGQSINGRLDNRFTASFNPLPGRTSVIATIYYSSVSSTIGDVSFTPDTASAKSFSFNAPGTRLDDFEFNDDITSTSQSFDANIDNQANIDLISRIDVTVRQPDGTNPSYTSGSLLLHAGQSGEITFVIPLTGPDGTYCFTATVKFGIDANHNGQLDNNDILGTTGTQRNCFFADTDDAPAGTVIAPPMTITRLCTGEDD